MRVSTSRPIAGLSMVSALLLVVLVGMVSAAAIPPRSGSDVTSPPSKRNIIGDPYEKPMSPGQPPGSDPPLRAIGVEEPTPNPKGPSDGGPGHKDPPPADVSQDFRLFISAQF